LLAFGWGHGNPLFSARHQASKFAISECYVNCYTRRSGGANLRGFGYGFVRAGAKSDASALAHEERVGRRSNVLVFPPGGSVCSAGLACWRSGTSLGIPRWFRMARTESALLVTAGSIRLLLPEQPARQQLVAS
jgi:hypothetical protein